MASQVMILVAGPYRSGTNDESVPIQRNVEAMEDIALQVFRRGHLPRRDPASHALKATTGRAASARPAPRCVR